VSESIGLGLRLHHFICLRGHLSRSLRKNLALDSLAFAALVFCQEVNFNRWVNLLWCQPQQIHRVYRVSHQWKSLTARLRMHVNRVGQNHIYTVYIRYFWQGNHQIYGHIRCIYTVLANLTCKELFKMWVFIKAPLTCRTWNKSLEREKRHKAVCDIAALLNKISKQLSICQDQPTALV